MASGAALAGGALALFVITRGARFAMPYIAAWLTLYLGAVLAIILLN